MTVIQLTVLPATALAGFAFGLGYFALLSRTTTLLATGRGWAGAAALTVARIAGAAVLLGLAAHFGALPLLAAFGGFLSARLAAMRLIRSAG